MIGGVQLTPCRSSPDALKKEMEREALEKKEAEEKAAKRAEEAAALKAEREAAAAVDPREMFRTMTDKYSQFDEQVSEDGSGTSLPSIRNMTLIAGHSDSRC